MRERPQQVRSPLRTPQRRNAESFLRCSNVGCSNNEERRRSRTIPNEAHRPTLSLSDRLLEQVVAPKVPHVVTTESSSHRQWHGRPAFAGAARR